MQTERGIINQIACSYLWSDQIESKRKNLASLSKSLSLSLLPFGIANKEFFVTKNNKPLCISVVLLIMRENHWPSMQIRKPPVLQVLIQALIKKSN